MRQPQPLDYHNVPRRRGVSRVSLSIAVTVRFLFLAWLIISLMLSGFIPSSWSLARWVSTLIFLGTPFLFTMWWVYRCFCTDEMNAVNVLGWALRPRALLRTVIADVCLLVIISICTGLISELW